MGKFERRDGSARPSGTGALDRLMHGKQSTHVSVKKVRMAKDAYTEGSTQLLFSTGNRKTGKTSVRNKIQEDSAGRRSEIKGMFQDYDVDGPLRSLIRAPYSR